ncbi:hypothetical protein [Hymenobacter sp. BRD67]|uniref:hypothetical protein n=1 Tax=Hymenobacter sp. BRD67 TaxID=2675877 RepID=UPI001567BD90|nr:hypothetical protein [Hymenobacter sp. BRD67]QKG53952.1 hypothetical protein GKZ67_16770 [Hymenobacter sp. BRD67]
MAPVYLTAALHVDFPVGQLLSPAEEAAYACRLREVENVLLCQAFGGQVPQPSSREQLQRYLNGEISRAEAFRQLRPVPRRYDN